MTQRLSPSTAALRQASIAGQITVLHAQRKQQSYPVREITQALDLSAKAITPALYMLGWQRTQYWDRTADGRRRLSVVWTPPGVKPLKPARGRPGHDIDAMLFGLTEALKEKGAGYRQTP
jgi:hypothetical protein